MALNEQQMQEKYQQFQVLQQHIEQISEQVQLMNQHSAELDSSLDSIAELEKMAVGNEILTPITNGIFLKTSLQNNNTLLVNVGADTVVEKKVPDVLKLLQEQKTEMIQRIVEAEALLKQLSEQAMKIYQEVQENVQ